MMKTFLTYFISVVISPIFIMIVATIFLPKPLSISGILIQTGVLGFVSIWLGTIIFSLFGLQPVPLMVFLIGIVFFFNYLIAYDFKDTGPILYNATLLGVVGSLSGVLIGGLYFFFGT